MLCFCDVAVLSEPLLSRHRQAVSKQNGWCSNNTSFILSHTSWHLLFEAPLPPTLGCIMCSPSLESTLLSHFHTLPTPTTQDGMGSEGSEPVEPFVSTLPRGWESRDFTESKDEARAFFVDLLQHMGAHEELLAVMQVRGWHFPHSFHTCCLVKMASEAAGQRLPVWLRGVARASCGGCLKGKVMHTD